MEQVENSFHLLDVRVHLIYQEIVEVMTNQRANFLILIDCESTFIRMAMVNVDFVVIKKI